MKKSVILVQLFLLCYSSLLCFLSVEASEYQPYEIPGTQVIPIQDSESGGQYELYIKLPEKYFENKSSQNKDAKYPVIYFTDAVWHIELLSASTAFLMEDVILVGISWQKDLKEDVKKELGEHASRFRDYTINKSSNPEHQAKYQFGQANKHLAFIRNDVIKYVESNYRTDPDNRTYFGYSAGGLFGAYVLLEQPDTFKNYILGSPSLKDNIRVLSELESNSALKGKGLSSNVFISHSALENALAEHIEEFIALLKKKNKESLSLQHVVIEGSHQTAFPMTGVRSVMWLSNLQREGNKL